MDTEINWRKVAVVFIAVAGVAFIFFLLGRKSVEKAVIAPAVTSQNIVAQPAEERVSASVEENKNIYKNEQYGFGIISLAQAQEATVCQSEVKYAYDPVREYVFSDKKIQCAKELADHEKFYAAQGGQLEALVFDTTKCNDTITDKVETVFCAKYGKTSDTEGRTVGSKWPAGKWVKDGSFITFFMPLASQDESILKSQYKFLMRIRTEE